MDEPSKSQTQVPANTGKKKETIDQGMRRVVTMSLLILMVAFIISFIVIMVKERKDNEAKDAVTVLNSVQSSIESAMRSYVEISTLVMIDQDVRNFLNAEDVDPGLSNDARFSTLNIISVCDNVDSVHIFRDDRKYVQTSKEKYDIVWGRMDETSWKAPIQRQRGGAIIKINGNGAVYNKNHKPILTICRDIYDINSQERIGILLMSISNSLLESIVNAQSNNKICIIGDHGLFLTGDEELAEYYEASFTREHIHSKSAVIDGHHGTVSGYQIPDMPLVVMCFTSSGIGNMSLESALCLALLVVSFIVALLLAGAYISSHITHPIVALTGEIERTKEAGWLETVTMELPDNEIGTLGESYNKMIEHLNELFESLIEKEKTIQRAEVRVLHEQIKPHFLYNSLETISALAIDAGATDVHSALETLGSFFRNFLSQGAMEIPLEKEIKIIQDYLSLQKLRYGDIIEDQYEVTEDASQAIIPKLILQPLVENGLYHGIRQKGEPGIIQIRSWLDDKDLHIVVKDTGVGMPQETIDHILGTKWVARNRDEQEKPGFGLSGTIERVRYFCGKEDVVKISSVVGEYTEIEFFIPKEKTERAETNV